MSEQKFTLPERYREKFNDVWSKTPDLSKGGMVINLGAGVPNFLPPREFVECLKEAMEEDDVSAHQYSNTRGHDRIRGALSKLFSSTFERDLDPEKEITVTLGAKEALSCAVNGLVNPGDEVIIIEPCFGLYQPTIKATQCEMVFVPLRRNTSDTSGNSSSAEWTISREELASKFTPKTRAIVMNTPNNPLGKVFTREELTIVADLCQEHDVVCISDEVYEWLLFDDSTHIKIASLPGMWERTITLGSAGKMMSCTGWRTGWAIGPAHLIDLVQAPHKATSLMTATPMQLGVAKCLELERSRWDQPESYRCRLAAETQANRDRLVDAFTSVGVTSLVPEGGYFLVADISPFVDPNSSDPEGDAILWLAEKKGLVVLPLGIFFSEENAHLGKNLVRLCMVKDKETMDNAEKIIRGLRD